MSHWNHRVVIFPDGRAQICEVHYGDDGNPTGWTQEPLALVAYPEEADVMAIADVLREDFALISGAFEKPPLVVEGDEAKEATP